MHELLPFGRRYVVSGEAKRHWASSLSKWRFSPSAYQARNLPRQLIEEGRYSAIRRLITDYRFLKVYALKAEGGPDRYRSLAREWLGKQQCTPETLARIGAIARVFDELWTSSIEDGDEALLHYLEKRFGPGSGPRLAVSLTIYADYLLRDEPRPSWLGDQLNALLPRSPDPRLRPLVRLLFPTYLASGSDWCYQLLPHLGLTPAGMRSYLSQRANRANSDFIQKLSSALPPAALSDLPSLFDGSNLPLVALCTQLEFITYRDKFEELPDSELEEVTLSLRRLAREPRRMLEDGGKDRWGELMESWQERRSILVNTLSNYLFDDLDVSRTLRTWFLRVAQEELSEAKLNTGTLSTLVVARSRTDSMSVALQEIAKSEHWNRLKLLARLYISTAAWFADKRSPSALDFNSLLGRLGFRYSRPSALLFAAILRAVMMALDRYERRRADKQFIRFKRRRYNGKISDEASFLKALPALARNYLAGSRNSLRKALAGRALERRLLPRLGNRSASPTLALRHLCGRRWKSARRRDALRRYLGKVPDTVYLAQAPRLCPRRHYWRVRTFLRGTPPGTLAVLEELFRWRPMLWELTVPSRLYLWLLFLPRELFLGGRFSLRALYDALQLRRSYRYYLARREYRETEENFNFLKESASVFGRPDLPLRKAERFKEFLGAFPSRNGVGIALTERRLHAFFSLSLAHSRPTTLLRLLRGIRSLAAIEPSVQVQEWENYAPLDEGPETDVSEITCSLRGVKAMKESIRAERREWRHLERHEALFLSLWNEGWVNLKPETPIEGVEP